MPIPLLVIPIVAGIAVLAGTTAVKAVKSKNSVKRVAILGRKGIGKTSLLQYLRDGELPAHPSSTQYPVPGGVFTLQLPDGSEARCSVAEDLPGSTVPAYKNWHEAFDQAEAVWYLFRADLVAADDADEIELIKGQLSHLEAWHSKLAQRDKAPQVILIGLYADREHTHRRDTSFEDRVRATELIDRASVKLGLADIVAGSLATPAGAERLVERISGHLW